MQRVVAHVLARALVEHERPGAEHAGRGHDHVVARRHVAVRIGGQHRDLVDVVAVGVGRVVDVEHPVEAQVAAAGDAEVVIVGPAQAPAHRVALGVAGRETGDRAAGRSRSQRQCGRIGRALGRRGPGDDRSLVDVEDGNADCQGSRSPVLIVNLDEQGDVPLGLEVQGDIGGQLPGIGVDRERGGVGPKTTAQFEGEVVAVGIEPGDRVADVGADCGVLADRAESGFGRRECRLAVRLRLGRLGRAGAAGEQARGERHEEEAGGRERWLR